MFYTKEQIQDGLVAYIDNEITEKLPVPQKILVGMGTALIIKSGQNLINDTFLSYGKQLCVVNDEGLIDADKLASALKESMNKYGDLPLDIPFIGTLTFNNRDVEALRGYIK